MQQIHVIKEIYTLVFLAFSVWILYLTPDDSITDLVLSNIILPWFLV